MVGASNLCSSSPHSLNTSQHSSTAVSYITHPHPSLAHISGQTTVTRTIYIYSYICTGMDCSWKDGMSRAEHCYYYCYYYHCRGVLPVRVGRLGWGISRVVHDARGRDENHEIKYMLYIDSLDTYVVFRVDEKCCNEVFLERWERCLTRFENPYRRSAEAVLYNSTIVNTLYKTRHLVTHELHVPA